MKKKLKQMPSLTPLTLGSVYLQPWMSRKTIVRGIIPKYNLTCALCFITYKIESICPRETEVIRAWNASNQHFSINYGKNRKKVQDQSPNLVYKLKKIRYREQKLVNKNQRSWYFMQIKGHNSRTEIILKSKIKLGLSSLVPDTV